MGARSMPMVSFQSCSVRIALLTVSAASRWLRNLPSLLQRLSPAVSSGKYVFYTFIGGELALLRSPGGSKRLPIHVLKLANFSRLT